MKNTIKGAEKSDEQQSPVEHDKIRENDKEAEEKIQREQQNEARKEQLDGPANDLIGQPTPENS